MTTLEQAQEALIIAAEVVTTHGKQFLPLFEQLERDVAELEKQDGALTRARRLAATQTATH